MVRKEFKDLEIDEIPSLPTVPDYRLNRGKRKLNMNRLN